MATRFDLYRATKLALRLLWERRRGTTSQKAGWLADLPESHDPPWRWRPADLLQLHYAPMAHAVDFAEKGYTMKIEWHSHPGSFAVSHGYSDCRRSLAAQ